MAKKRHEVLKRKPVSNRTKKLRQWSKESMAKALDAVASGKMGVNKTAIELMCLVLVLRIESQAEYLMAATWDQSSI